MTATTQIQLNGNTYDVAKGDEITVTTASGEIIEGVFVSLTARGLRINATPVLGTSRYITRKMSVVTDITLGALPVELPEADEPPAEDAAPATGEVTTFTDPAQPETDEAPELDELDAELRALLLENSTEFGHGATEIERIVEAAAAEQAAPAPAAEINEDAPAADYDTDPMVGGKHLSEMKFAEVMELAKKYKTPGRGVARVDALRAGVALAISQEVARLAQG